MIMVEWFLWICIWLLVWTYAIYPVFIWLLSLIYPSIWKEKAFTGKVSMIVAAYNEEDVIREKIENSLKLNFGICQSEIIFISDGSTDATEMILNEYQQYSNNMKIIIQHLRGGKSQALNIGVEKAKGDILIFSDANVMINEDACKALLKPFYDKKVGAVCGKVLVKARGKQEVAGESLYMKYEGWVQRSEAKFVSMVGIDGALFALRREFFTPLNPGIILDDFTLSMNVPLAGSRIVYAKDALAMEEVMPSVKNEFKRKVRIVAGGYQYLAGFFNRNGSIGVLVWFEFISHKILKWAAPFAMIFIFFTNLLLINIAGYKLLFAAQVIFYLLALSGHIFIRLRKVYIVYVPYYFCVVNLAALVGCARYFNKGQKSLWVKVDR